jgi:hypothetical protein
LEQVVVVADEAFQLAPVDVVEGLAVRPGEFEVVDFEAAVWGDPGWVIELVRYDEIALRGERGGGGWWLVPRGLDGTQVISCTSRLVWLRKMPIVNRSCTPDQVDIPMTSDSGCSLTRLSVTPVSQQGTERTHSAKSIAQIPVPVPISSTRPGFLMGARCNSPFSSMR